MEQIPLRDVVDHWSLGDKSNLLYLLGEKHTKDPSTENIEEQFTSLYHSKSRAYTASALQNLSTWATSRLTKKERAEYIAPKDLITTPTYTELLLGACKHLDLIDKDTEELEIEKAELYLSHAIIVEALKAMSPDERIAFFSSGIQIEEISPYIKGKELNGPVTTLAALGAAQASGFGVYMASSTALGFLTHAMGVTLPFAVYTGMSSTIAYVIGPAGWLAAAFWAAWKITEADWKKIIPGLIYIIHVNSARRLSIPPESST